MKKTGNESENLVITERTVRSVKKKTAKFIRIIEKAHRDAEKSKLHFP